MDHKEIPLQITAQKESDVQKLGASRFCGRASGFLPSLVQYQVKVFRIKLEKVRESIILHNFLHWQTYAIKHQMKNLGGIY